MNRCRGFQFSAPLVIVVALAENYPICRIASLSIELFSDYLRLFGNLYAAL